MGPTTALVTKTAFVATAVSATFFAYRYGWVGINPLKLWVGDTSLTPLEAEDSKPGSKLVSDSAVTAMYRITDDMTDEYGRLYAGEMLKIIDVIAGVVSRRHADMGCVTISLDRFILVQELRTGDVIRINASCNRSWGSSLETGVKVVREDPATGLEQYCCHAYLTFVAIAPSKGPQAGPSSSLRLGGRDNGTHSRPRPKLKRIMPTTLIEKKRYLLAGRRRELRMAQPPQGPRFAAFRAEILGMSYERGSSSPEEQAQGRIQARQIASLEKELLAEALKANDTSLLFITDNSGQVSVTFNDSEQGLDPPTASIEELHDIINSRSPSRRATWTELGASQRSSSMESSGTWAFTPQQRSPVQTLFLSPLVEEGQLDPGPPQTLSIQDTLATTLHIVLPQHANSAGVLFGGQLMEWMEKTALLSASRLRMKKCSWVTAAMDRLEFREAVAVGHVLTFRAVITKIWTSSMEVYVCSHADVTDPAAGPGPRFTNECFLTLVALSRKTSSPFNINSEVIPKLGAPSTEVWEGADDRKQERLDLKEMLVRVYAQPTEYDVGLGSSYIST